MATPMSGLRGQRIFTVGGTTYVWEDVVLAGHLWGDWRALEERLRQGLACLAHLDDLDEDDGDGLDDEEVDTAAADFRYARDLVAAEDMEAWLERCGLTVDAWTDAIRRGLLLEKWSENVSEIAEEYEIEAEELDAAIDAEAICSGVAGALSARLAARAAVHARAAGNDGVGDADVRTVLAAVPDDVPERVPGLTPADARARLERLARLEAHWRRFTATEAAPERLRAVIAANRLEWVVLDVRTVTTGDRDTASELALCVREDGQDLAAAAAAAGFSVTSERWHLDEVDAALRDHVIGAEPGHVLGPLPSGDAFVVVVVVAKDWPSEDDPETQARAAQALLEGTVRREVDDRVTWHAAL
jgi:hypothetical protein